jgi:truncated hemoglobin YjbI
MSAEIEFQSWLTVMESSSLTTMSSNEVETTIVTKANKPAKKMKPARKQVKPGDVEKKETPQTGKEYSES